MRPSHSTHSTNSCSRPSCSIHTTYVVPNESTRISGMCPGRGTWLTLELRVKSRARQRWKLRRACQNRSQDPNRMAEPEALTSSWRARLDLTTLVAVMAFALSGLRRSVHDGGVLEQRQSRCGAAPRRAGALARSEGDVGGWVPLAEKVSADIPITAARDAARHQSRRRGGREDRRDAGAGRRGIRDLRRRRRPSIRP